MSETITINEKEYEIESLSDNAKAAINRVMTLRKEAMELRQLANEKDALISLYSDSVVEEVEGAGEADDDTTE